MVLSIEYRKKCIICNKELKNRTSIKQVVLYCSKGCRKLGRKLKAKAFRHRNSD